MNKLLKRLFTPLAVFTMAISLGVSVNAQNDLIGTEAASSIYTIADFTLKTANSTSYNSNWNYGSWSIYGAANNNGGWAYLKFGGKNTTLTNANPTYFNNTTKMESPISKINVSLLLGTLGTAGMGVTTWGVKVYSDNAMTTLIDESSLTGLTKPSAAISYDFVPSTAYQNANSTIEWPINSFYKVYFDCTNTSGTNGIVWVDKVIFYKETSLIPVSGVSIQVPVSTNVPVGTPLDLNETVLPVDATDKTVTWSSSDISIAEVNQVGLVTGIKAGTVTITATSNADVTKKDTIILTITSSLNVYDKTLTGSDFGMLSSYVDGNYEDEDVVYYANQVMKISGSDGLQFRGTPFGSYLYNKTEFLSDIDTIRIKLSSMNNEFTYALYVGTAPNPNSTITAAETTDTRDPSVKIFDVAALGNYKYFSFIRTSATGTVYLDGITVELVNSELESARTFANSFLSILDPECSTQSVNSGTWTSLSSNYNALSPDAKLAFSNELSLLGISDIQKALSRYRYIVNKYSYDNFMSIVILNNSQKTLPQRSSEHNIAAILTIGIISMTTILGYYFIMKKKDSVS